MNYTIVHSNDFEHIHHQISTKLPPMAALIILIPLILKPTKFLDFLPTFSSMPTPLPISLSSILLLSLVSHATDYTDPIINCQDDSQYTRGSAFEENLKLVLDSLSANTPATGFNNTAIDTGDDRVYGQALCRGDVNSTICKNCIQKAGEDIFEKCRSKDAMIWYERCQIQYALAPFFSQMVYTGKYSPQNEVKKNVSDPSGFSNCLEHLMSNISKEAVSNSSKNMFSTGEIEFPRKMMIYGLVQCTRDISQSLCETCLDSAMRELLVCCSGREGGAVFSRTCNVRFEVFQFYNASPNLIIFPSSSVQSDDKLKIQISVAVLCTSALILLAVVIGYFIVQHRRKINAKKDEESNRKTMLLNLGAPQGVTITEEGEFVNSEELIFMDLNIVKAATDNFSEWNKLGQGGFGSVYKGILADGKEIAVKRLSRKSRQGLVEFKNEIILIARLQHKNLVKLIGCTMSGEEKLLIYEFMPNNSLDTYIFDSKRRLKLGWMKCFEIIVGIARGLLYLHQDSRLTIIHRDLKPSNMLLDREMAAKISDFGMARIFYDNQDTANTKRVVGSFGYMAPEYAMEGVFSVKSDVYSFGVVLLEIVSGRRNNGFHQNEQGESLPAHAWRLWSKGKEAELVEPWLLEPNSKEQAVRCIQIGLLCVQADPADRPTMASVMVLLGGESTTTLPRPNQPAFSVGRTHLSSSNNSSVDGITLSSISPR